MGAVQEKPCMTTHGRVFGGSQGQTADPGTLGLTGLEPWSIWSQPLSPRDGK